MPILFSVVARGTIVLAKYASCAGNFTEVTEQILSKIPPHDDRLTYSHGNYLFHYIAENKLVYFCITDDVSNVSPLIIRPTDLVKELLVNCFRLNIIMNMHNVCLCVCKSIMRVEEQNVHFNQYYMSQLIVFVLTLGLVTTTFNSADRLGI